MNRRTFFTTAAAATLASQVSAQSIAKAAADPAYVIKNKGIKHTLMGWCWKPMDMLVLAKHAKDIGLVGIEGIDSKLYPDVKKLGLDISLVGSHGFAKGPCNPAFKDEVVTKLTDSINLAADVGSKKVITFTGMKFDGMDRDAAIKNCLDAWKAVLP
ncbi:MAG TPA: hypothetical protein VGE39_25855, partial [Prosthecobacter sp.]